MNSIAPLPLALPPPRLTIYDHVLGLLPKEYDAAKSGATTIDAKPFTAALDATRTAYAYEGEALETRSGYSHLSTDERTRLYGPDWRNQITEPLTQVQWCFQAIAQRAVALMTTVADNREYAAQRAAWTRQANSARRRLQADMQTGNQPARVATR